MDNIVINNNDDNDKRIDLYLIDKMDMSRSKIQDAIKKGQILVNDKKVKNSYNLKENDVISFNIISDIDTDILPENIPLDIVYEDEDVIVVNKKMVWLFILLLVIIMVLLLMLYYTILRI